MKIAGNIPNIYQTYATEKNSKVDKKNEFGELLKSKEAVLKDKVEISGAAVKMQKNNGMEIEFFKRHFIAIDGNRDAKIEKLKESIKNGKYNVSEDEIVEAILNNGKE